MSKLSTLVARASRLPLPENHDVQVERDLDVKMSDGTVLKADRWFSPESVSTAPIVLMRSPYGRRQFAMVGKVFAERGYQAVIQSCRGTFGSGGEFEPFRNEASDGVDTLHWIGEQPWFTGSVATWGPSYLGLVQWAVMGEAPDYLKAAALNVTTSDVRDVVVYPGGSFSLQTGAAWVDLVLLQEFRPRDLVRALAGQRKRINIACSTLPLSQADMKAHGQTLPFYQDWLVHELAGDDWWEDFSHSKHSHRAPPATLVGGWYDIFLPGQVADYVRLRDAGREARLTIGPWTHASFPGGAMAVRDGLDWFDVHLRGQTPRNTSPVRLFVMGDDRWVDVESWPPPASEQRWYLRPDRRLGPDAPAAGPKVDRYRYDPSDPTPSIGGPTLHPMYAGRRRQNRREERADVLSYTTPAFTQSLTVAGPLRAELWVRTSHPYVDFFVRLCDVDPKGRSVNISDGIVRPHPPDPGTEDGVRRVVVEMWPTAVTFRPGHQMRLQVSGGAHPMFARNTGSGERLGVASSLVPADVEIYRDVDHPSAIVLPVSAI